MSKPHRMIAQRITRLYTSKILSPLYFYNTPFSFPAWSFICPIIRSNPGRWSLKEADQRKTPVLESPFNKVAALQDCNFSTKRLQHRCFAVNIVKFLRTPTMKNICKRLLLHNKFQRLSSACQGSINLSLSESLSFYFPFWYHVNWFVWCIIFHLNSNFCFPALSLLPCRMRFIPFHSQLVDKDRL